MYIIDNIPSQHPMIYLRGRFYERVYESCQRSGSEGDQQKSCSRIFFVFLWEKLIFSGKLQWWYQELRITLLSLTFQSTPVTPLSTETQAGLLSKTAKYRAVCPSSFLLLSWIPVTWYSLRTMFPYPRLQANIRGVVVIVPDINIHSNNIIICIKST